MPTAICPNCDEEVYVEVESEQGDTVSCDECHESLVVVGLDPIELDLADEDRDSYDEDDDEDGDFEY